MESSDAVSTRIREEAAKLEEFFPRITSCRVVVEVPHRHHKRRDLFHVRIDLGVPGRELVVSHDPSPNANLSHGKEGQLQKHIEILPEHQDVYVSIRDAFASARRQLQGYARHLRGEVKSHARTADTKLP